VISYYEEYLKAGGDEDIKVALEKLLFHNNFNRLVECIVIMIAEDVSNIMKIVKGIIIKLDVNGGKSRRSARVRVS
jgi:oligoendopeptidase F